MKILVADSNFSDLCKTIVVVARLFPKDEISCSIEAEAVLELSRTHSFNIIFLAPDFPSKMVDTIRIISPSSRIIFTTRPFSQDDLVLRLKELIPPRKRLYIQTFGGFNVFCDGKPMVFKRTKAKELLALLVDRRGSPVTTSEGVALIFEGKLDTPAQKSYYRILAAELVNTLRREGLEHIITKTHNSMSIDIKTFECDAYQFLKGDPEALGKYNGDYMTCYKWAEHASALFAVSEAAKKRRAEEEALAAQKNPKPKRKPRQRRKTSSTKEGATNN